MSEESQNTQEEKKLEVPILSISTEDLEKNKQALETAKNILTPPEGQVLAGLRSFCPIHGDITKASKIIKHTIYMKNEETGNVEPVSYSDVICLACVSNFWRKQIVANYPKDADGSPGDIKVAPVFISKAEYEKLVKEQEQQVSEEAQEQEEVKE